MVEKAPSVVEAIRKSLHDSSASGGGGIPEEILYVPQGGMKVVRFLSEFDEAIPVVMHDLFKVLMPQPCLKYYKKDCPYHDKKYRTLTWYAWTVYDYEAESKRIALWKSTTNSPIEDLLDIYDSNGTIKDRDIKISRVGEGMKSHYKAKEAQSEPTKFEGKYSKVIPQDKVFQILAGMIKDGGEGDQEEVTNGEE